MAFDLQFVDSIGQIYDPITDTFTRYFPTALNANPFFETNAANWTGTGGTVARSTAQAHEGVASLLFTPDGVTASTDARSENVPATVGTVYRASVWVRCAVSRNVSANINWRDAGGTLLSTSNLTVAVVADTWTLIDFTATAPASTAQAQLTASMGSTPLASHLLYVDEARLTTGGGWGTADTGQVWELSGGLAAQYGVSGGAGRHAVEVVNASRRTRLPVSLTDVEVLMSFSSDVLALGGNQECSPMLRIDPADIGGTYYYAEVEFSTTQTVRCRLVRRLAGVDTGLTVAADIPGLVHAAGRMFWARARAYGPHLAVRIWQDGTAEPTIWHATASDAAITGPGQVGVRTILDPGNTNTLPVNFAVGDFTAAPVMQVRLDLNDDLPWRTLGEGTEFGPPPLRRAVVSTLMQDGEHVPAAAYGNRMLSLTLDCQLPVTDFDGAAAAFQELSRELDRPGNFLRYRPGTTQPVFFRTLRSDFTSVVWDAVLRRASVSVLAEPFAYGLPEFLPAVTVYNDPAEGTTLNANPFFEVDASGWVGQGGTVAWSNTAAHEGVGSILLTPDGVSATAEARTTSLVPATAGVTYRASAWVRCASTRNVAVAINWHDAGGVFISQSLTTVAVVAVTWTLIEVTGTAPALTAQARLVAGLMTGTPSGADTVRIDEARLRQSGGVGGMCFDVTGIKGDVPAVTKIATDLAFYNNRMLIATRRRGTPANLQFAYQAESMTQGTDTTTQPNDPFMSGAGNNFSRCTFATATMQTRLTLAAFPSASSDDGRGTYRVLARVRKSVSGDVINMQMLILPSGAILEKTTLNTTTSTYHEDLGLVSVPFGTDPVTDGPSGMELDVAQYEVRLMAERVSGTGTLDIDYVLFIPADDELAFVEFGAASTGDGYVFDSHHDMVYAVKGGAVDMSEDIIPVAGLPTLRPGVTNRIYIVQGVDVTEAVTATSTAAVTTWPRYVNVRGTS